MSHSLVLLQAKNTVTAPDMERPVTELAQAIQEAMAALFNLQTALVNYFSNKNSKGLVEAFQKIRDMLRADWDSSVLFLQRCQGYAGDYISLCQYSAMRQAPETLAFAKDVLEMAKSLSQEVSVLRTKHEKVLNDVEKHAKNLPAEFQKQIFTAGSEVTKPAAVGDSQLVQMVHESFLRSDGAQALSASRAALDAIRTSLRDLDVFWKDQVDQLASAAKPGTIFRLTKEDLRRLEDTWRGYQSVMQRVMSSISASSDAVQVDPIGAPQHQKGAGDSKGGTSFWSKLFGFFFRWGTAKY